MLDEGIAPDDEKSISRDLDNLNVTIRYEDDRQRVYLNGTDVTGRLRDESTGRMASVVSKHPCVREKLVSLQQKLAGEDRVIMDGRDIGTKVLPDAALKIFLTASPEVRAKRRYDELVLKGVECDLETILADIKERDMADENRKVSPLKPAEDAVLLDTSDMSQKEVADKIIELYEGIQDRL